jgi:S1-C subfamily serine protease
MSFASPVRYLVALAAVAVPCGVCAAQAYLGFTVSAETDGFFSAALKKVTVTGVVRDAPAGQAGLLAGDDVESVNDVPVAGTRGSRIMDRVHAVQPGGHLQLKVLRGGVGYLIDIVGGAPK